MELLAFVAAALAVLVAPGLAVAQFARGRGRGRAVEAAEFVAIAYSGIAVVTLSIWTLSRLLGFSWATVLAASSATLALALAATYVRAAPRPLQEGLDGGAPVESARRAATGDLRVLVAAGVGFALVCCIPFVSFGWESAEGIHRMAMTDWYKHLVTTTALTAADVFPPPNPFLHTAEGAPYYYGFHLLGASLARVAGLLSGGDPGPFVFPALLLLTMATATAVPFVAYTVARTIASVADRHAASHARVPLVAALGATFLAGFDLIPMTLDAVVNVATGGPFSGVGNALRTAVPSTHLDYWIHHNERQFSAPFLTTIWAPQHMAAVLVALMALHAVVRRGRIVDVAGEPRPKNGWVLPALLLAGLPALSAYVAVGLAVGVGAAILWEAASRREAPWQTVAWRWWAVPGTAAAVLTLPVAGVLMASDTGPGFVMHVSDAGGWVNGAVFSSWIGASTLARLVDSPAVLAVEFGVLGVLALIEIRRRAREKRLTRQQGHVVAVAVAILLFAVLVRPPVGGPNNLYARSLVVVWFLFAPFAAMGFVRARERGTGKIRLLAVGVALCLLATGYALVGAVVEGALFWAMPVARVQTAMWVSEHAEPGALVAVHPDDFGPAFGYWLRRPIVLGDRRHAELFGAPGAAYESAAVALTEAYAAPTPETAAARFDALGAAYIVVNEDVRTSAAWRLEPCFESLYQNGRWNVVRRVSCETIAR